MTPARPPPPLTGLEIRVQVTQYVSDKIRALRLNPGSVDPDNADDVAAAAADAAGQPVAKRQKVEQAQADAGLEPGKLAPVRGIKPELMPPEGYAYGNVSVLRANAMKFLPNFFEKGQVRLARSLPSFAQKTVGEADPALLHPRSCPRSFSCSPTRISSSASTRRASSRASANVLSQGATTQAHPRSLPRPTLLAEYAYVLRPGGLLYTITDVPDLHQWMTGHIGAFPLFHRLTEDEIDKLGLESGEGVEGQSGSELQRERERAVMEAVKRRTEEGKKVERNQGGKEWSVWRRLPDPE